jgi:UDP-GlcNAc3NAcA epimerase
MTSTIVTVIGARPQFVKAAVLSRTLRGRCREVLVHTGQHYDRGMSDVFFEELALPEPDHNLGINGGRHGAQTGAMMAAIEEVLVEIRPDLVLVYGDTNSTLAGALAGAKLVIPVAHVEAGLRSFNRAMPEEVNRVVTDHLASLLFAPSETAQRQLASEGITRGVHVVGDIMYDAVLEHRAIAAQRSAYPQCLGLAPGQYLLCTIHRAENADDRQRLGGILDGLARLDRPVVLPVHPRTRERLRAFALTLPANVHGIAPVGYLDMLALEAGSALILTDSGGVQKEAYYLEVPCVTLRDETEWVETVDAGCNMLAGADPARIEGAVRHMLARLPSKPPQLYGDGSTAGRITEVVVRAAHQGEM